MTITYSEVRAFREKLRPDITNYLRTLEDSLACARDKGQLPVYLTKWRVKSTDSIYLKTKRKKDKALDEFTDIGGLRILCMFEQDLLPVHKFLIGILADTGYELREFNVFNWHDDSFKYALKSEIDKRANFRGYESELEGRQGAYKSIHYVVTRVAGEFTCKIEIQLRTLLQDVWGELEHALVYKKSSVHPHVKKSFDLLARDLETKDLLITHLKDVCEKERLVELISLDQTGPYRVFWYAEDIIPELFRGDGEIEELFAQYSQMATKSASTTECKKFVAELEKVYKKIRAKLHLIHEEDWKVKYWLEMEKAFILFCKGKYDDAKTIYEAITERGTDQYVPFFRLGEIRFIRGDIENALVAFDESEELLERCEAEGKKRTDSYRLKVT